MTEQQQHPITPSQELVQQWFDDFAPKWFDDFAPKGLLAFAIQAARWGADQELEACIEWLWKHQYDIASVRIRAARRPKPPSLAEQALEACERSAFGLPGDRDIIRAALERLQKLEQQENNDN